MRQPLEPGAPVTSHQSQINESQRAGCPRTESQITESAPALASNCSLLTAHCSPASSLLTDMALLALRQGRFDFLDDLDLVGPGLE
jgi:hypothetical protein